MLVYVADLLLDYLVRGPWRDPKGFNFPTTAEFDPVATVPILIEGGRLHLGCVVALVGGRRGAVLLGRTINGFEIRVVGEAPRAARFAGFNSDQLILLTFAISGALAGLAGHHRGRRPGRPAPARHLARLRLHRHHRRLPRPAESGRHI